MILFYRLLILALAQYIFSSGAAPAYAAHLNCSDSSVTFECEGSGEFGCVCTTVKAAIDFLKSIGLETTDCITIKLVEHIPSGHNHTLIGAYDPISQEVALLTYAKAVELSQMNESPSGIDLSEELWCSYAAHELAHAVSCRYLNPEIESHTAGEYISSVTQLTVLPINIREQFLKKYNDVEAYQSREEMSELYFLTDPNRFAVKCYLHFMSLKNSAEFIKSLVKEGNGY